MIKYPNGKEIAAKGKTDSAPKKRVLLSAKNRGMKLEDDINVTNEYYRDNKLCLITKRPTPINIVRVDYSKGAKIVDAYFEKQSTTDYNGVYKGKYIDFEAKSTESKTSFPIANITSHQLKHLENVLFHGGIAFFIIEFTRLDEETYLLDAKYILDFIKEGKRKSIPLDDVRKFGHKIKRGYMPRLDYLPVMEEVYFSK